MSHRTPRYPSGSIRRTWQLWRAIVGLMLLAMLAGLLPVIVAQTPSTATPPSTPVAPADAPAGSSTDAPATVSAATATVPATQPIEPQATPTPLTLTVWVPDELASLDQQGAYDLFVLQMETIGEMHDPPVRIDIRLKRPSDVGGIMSTLRSASNVAPGALPDLTLLRRQDLITAERANLIQPLERLIPSSVLGGLDQTLKLGQIDGQLYGLPYMVDFWHLAVPDAITDAPQDWSFRTLERIDETLLMPAAYANGLNPIFFAQYLSAGGTVDGSGALIYNEQALGQVLEFYEQARVEGLIPPEVLNYFDDSDYIDRLTLPINSVDRPPLAIVRSSTYFNSLVSTDDYAPATLPTSGLPSTVMDGWVWVMVARSQQQQNLSVELISAMMSVERQAEFATLSGFLPAEQEAFSALDWQPELLSFYTAMLDQGVLPLSDSDGGNLPRRIQDAIAAILRGELRAETALQQISSAQAE